MTVFRHELRQCRTAFWIWTGVVAGMLGICVFLYPEMKSQMMEMNDMFSSMGTFTAAFGMDRLNFGTLLGYYAVECGNVLGMGGAFYAAFCAAAMLSKEENRKTADFLLTHPVSRRRIVGEKLLAVGALVTAMNLVILAVCVASLAAVGEAIPWKEMLLLHLAYYLLQLEIAGICFGLSAFLRRGSVGAGLGVAALLYFLNIVANITDEAEFLKYVTPYGYCDGADIVDKCALDGPRLAVGGAIFALCVAAAWVYYPKKDIV